MALGADGQLSLGDINVEGGRTRTTADTRLKGLSDGTHFTVNSNSDDRPDGNAPYTFTKFRSYDHSASAGATNTGTEYSVDYANYNPTDANMNLVCRWDANMATSYSSGNSVSDIGGSDIDGTMSNVTWTDGGSSTSPSYWTFNGTNSKISLTNSSTSFLEDHYSGSTSGEPGMNVFIWHRPNSDHTGTLLSVDEGSSGERSFKIGVKTGNLRTASAWYSEVGSSNTGYGDYNEFTMTSDSGDYSIPANDGWELLTVNFRKVKGSGRAHSWKRYLKGEMHGGIEWNGVQQWSSIKKQSSAGYGSGGFRYCFEGDAPNITIGQDYHGITSSPYDGDIACIWIFQREYGDSAAYFSSLGTQNTYKFDGCTRGKHGWTSY